MNKKLCSHCKTGKETYEKDKYSPVCPYLNCHNGKECTMFMPIDTEQNSGIFEFIHKKTK